MSAVQNTEDYGDFLDKCPGAAYLIEGVPEGEDIYYTLRNGTHYDGIPAKCVFLCNKIYELRQCVNAIPYCIPKKEATRMFSAGYFKKGHSLESVIKEAIDPNFKIITAEDPVYTRGDVSEVYLDGGKLYVVPTPLLEKYPIENWWFKGNVLYVGKYMTFKEACQYV